MKKICVKKQTIFLAILILLPFQVNAKEESYFAKFKNFISSFVPKFGEESLKDFDGRKLELKKEEEFFLLENPFLDEQAQLTYAYDIETILKKRMVIQLEVVNQSGVDCGFHSLYNASCLMRKKYSEILDNKKCEFKVKSWKKLSGNSCAGSIDMEKIIKKDIPELSKNNFSIIDEDMDLIINSLNTPGGEFKETIKASNEQLFENIKKFRKNGAPQVVVVNFMMNGDDVVDAYEEARKCEHAQYHWIAVSLEKENNGSLRIIFLDSLNLNLSNHPILDKLVYLFDCVEV